MKPIAFIRPDDWELFTLNRDRKTYSLRMTKKMFPGKLHGEYSAETLRLHKFHEVYKTKAVKK